MDHQSVAWVDSKVAPGVSFCVRKASFRRRAELLQQVRQISGRHAFLAAGQSLEDQLGAVILEREIDELYLRWGLLELRGLQIDGAAATLDLLLESGPEELCAEILACVHRECGLNDDEAKN